MSLRQIAKQLGVSPAYLSYMVNGKRPWRPDLKAGYDELVNTVNASVPGVNIGSPVHTPLSAQAQQAVSAPIIRLPMAGARGSRTHRPDRRAGANGFEVRKAHQDPSAPAFCEAGPASGRSGRIIVMPATFLADRRSGIPADFALLYCTPGATPTESGNYSRPEHGGKYDAKLHRLSSYSHVAISSDATVPPRPGRTRRHRIIRTSRVSVPKRGTEQPMLLPSPDGP